MRALLYISLCALLAGCASPHASPASTSSGMVATPDGGKMNTR